MKVTVFTTIVLLISCVSCGKKEPKTTSASNLANDEAHSHLQCSVIPSKTVVQDDERVSLRIQIIGGEPPYDIPAARVIGTQKSEITVSGAFENHTSANRVVSNQVQVSDADGETASCPFSITVRPEY